MPLDSHHERQIAADCIVFARHFAHSSNDWFGPSEIVLELEEQVFGSVGSVSEEVGGQCRVQTRQRSTTTKS